MGWTIIRGIKGGWHLTVGYIGGKANRSVRNLTFIVNCLEFNKLLLQGTKAELEKTGGRPSPKSSNFCSFPSPFLLLSVRDKWWILVGGEAVGHEFVGSSQMQFLPVYKCSSLARPWTCSSQQAACGWQSAPSALSPEIANVAQLSGSKGNFIRPWSIKLI